MHAICRSWTWQDRSSTYRSLSVLFEERANDSIPRWRHRYRDASLWVTLPVARAGLADQVARPSWISLLGVSANRAAGSHNRHTGRIRILIQRAFRAFPKPSRIACLASVWFLFVHSIVIPGQSNVARGASSVSTASHWSLATGNLQPATCNLRLQLHVGSKSARRLGGKRSFWRLIVAKHI